MTHFVSEDPCLICPEVLLSDSALMLVSAVVALISLDITKRTSNLIDALCNYLCSLSRANLRGYTAVHTSQQHFHPA